MSQAIALPPCLLTSDAAPHMSGKYVQISTAKVSEILREIGFGIASVNVDRVRKSSPEFARHMVRYRRESDSATPRNLSDYVPEVLLLNSHNGKSRATISLGVYRFVCANGMVVGTSYGSEAFRHSGDIAKDVSTHVQKLTDRFSQITKQIDQWKKIDLTAPKRLEFARKAAIIRFGEEKAAQWESADMLNARREEDDRGDLWTTFNRIQENGVKGGLRGLAPRQGRAPRVLTSKAIRGIDSDVNFNSQLWRIAEEIAA